MFDGIASPLYEIIREPIVSFPHRNALLYDNPSLGGLLDLVAHFKNESYAHPGGVFHILETP